MAAPISATGKLEIPPSPTAPPQEASDENVASGVLGGKGLQSRVLETFIKVDDEPQPQRVQQDGTVPDTDGTVQQGKADTALALQQPHLPEPAAGSEQDMGNMLYKSRPGALREPLTLLHLSADVLELIIKKITHTNDLCALSLTCSALHAFAIPHIYSRFDIVWPDSAAQLDTKSGVDALTYGLSTLVMAEELFGEGPAHQQQPVRCEACGHVNIPRPQQQIDQQPRPDSEQSLGDSVRRRRRYGNHYAQYCRKFSLGNGPKEWVQDYMISKEAGKLLGTQVALAVARMRNLESFVWDMPTGVLHEVWMALASLDDYRHGKPCRLERIWIRWHNNVQLLSETDDGDDAENTPTPTSMQPYSSRCERPTFSILPPLKSLSVVDIDEIDYLDEMAVLIQRSRHCLRELRVGIASYIWQSSVIADRHLMAKLQSGSRPLRMGGVLGTLFAQIFSVTSGGITRIPEVQQSGEDVTGKPGNALSSSKPASSSAGSLSRSHSQPDVAQSAVSLAAPASPAVRQATAPAILSTLQPASLPSNKQTLPIRSKTAEEPLTRPQGERLPLEVLELERVPLSVFTMREAIDWSKLTEITLLDCAKHERFWRALRRQFSRQSSRASSWYSAHPSETAQSPRFPRSSLVYDEGPCALKLRKIHVNAVSPALICFIRDTLAPHTLQTLFLHASFDTEAIYNVGGTRHASLDDIYRNAVRRHARSLVKLSIDSGMRAPEPRTTSSLAITRKAWTLTREVLAFITSGTMRALRELSVCLDHRDWHFFLQRLPSLYHLQSLYIPQILDRSTKRPIGSEAGSSSSSSLGSAREFAQQVLDIIVLRPEVQLCYLGVFEKCFELLEGRNRNAGPWGGSARDSDDDDNNDDDDDDDDDENNNNNDNDDDYDDQHDEDDEEQEHDDEDDGGHDHDPEADGQVEEDDEEDDEVLTSDDDDDDNQGPSTHHHMADDASEDEDDDDDGQDGGHGQARRHAGRRYHHGGHHHDETAVWLREILFYDDKVAVFRARLGRL